MTNTLNLNQYFQKQREEVQSFFIEIFVFKPGTIQMTRNPESPIPNRYLPKSEVLFPKPLSLDWLHSSFPEGY